MSARAPQTAPDDPGQAIVPTPHGSDGECLQGPGRRVGRPSSYNETTAAEFCRRLADGETETAICRDAAMPSRETLRQWRRIHPDFLAECARARRDQAHWYADRCREEADDCDADTAHVAKVRISAYQWLASKLEPRAYGDHATLEIAGAGGGPLASVNLNVTDPIEAARVYQSLIAGK